MTTLMHHFPQIVLVKKTRQGMTIKVSNYLKTGESKDHIFAVNRVRPQMGMRRFAKKIWRAEPCQNTA